MATGYMIYIRPSATDDYGPKKGWGTVYGSRVDAEAAKARAERHAWHGVRVVEVDVPKYRWRTDAASGTVLATAPEEALTALVNQGEWPDPDSPRERWAINDGAWLTIFDEDGVPALRRGQMP